MKKAQGMSLNMVIVAAIVLVVLIVLVLIFSGKTKVFGSKTTETTAQYSSNRCEVPGTNNECTWSKEDCESQGGAYVYNSEYSDCEECCMK